VDGADLRRVLAEMGAELLLHGHDHRRSLVWLQGAGNKKIPAVGVPSASAYAKYAHEDPAGYNIFRIEGSSGDWRCETVSYQRGADGVMRECARFRIYGKPDRPARRKYGGQHERGPHAGEESKRQHRQCPPAATPAVVPRHLIGNARQQIGISLKRALPLDQPACNVSCNRLHDVGDFVGFRQHAAPHSAVVEKSIKTLVAAHRDVGKRVDPKPWRFTATDAAVE